jgi:hypothetical protein
MHTSNRKDTDRAFFSLTKTEIEWFLGGFVKRNCKGTNRRLVFVWKLDGYWNKRLLIVEVHPADLFGLFVKSNGKKEKITTETVGVSLVRKNGDYYLTRRNREIKIEKQKMQKVIEDLETSDKILLEQS